MHKIFNVCSNHTTFELQRTRIQNAQFAVYTSDTSVTLKQSQGYQTQNQNVDPKQSYYHSKSERSCFNGIKENQSLKFFFRWGNIHLP